MSYHRDATKRPTRIVTDNVWREKSGHADPSYGLKSASRDAYEDAIHDARDAYVQVSRNMLVRLNIKGSNGECTPVLCVSHELKHTGLKMRLPCRLNLSPGMVLDIELFTVFRKTPIALKAVVQRVVRAVGEDIVRYVVEVRFKSLTPAAEHEINAFIHLAQLDERRIMLS